MTARVVVTDHPFDQVEREMAAARDLGASFEAFTCLTEEQAMAAADQADVLLVNLAPVTRNVLARLAAGAVVIRYGVGHDNIDLDAARELGVRVTTVADYGTATVADHAVAMVLCLLRRIPAYDKAVREMGWCAPHQFGSLRSFDQTTVGLVGAGRIGLALADRLKSFRFRVVAYDPFVAPARLAEHDVEPADLRSLLESAHAVSLHLPLTSTTRHVIDAAALAAMPTNAVLVNTSRGGLVDSIALADALERADIAAAALDVFETEPLPAGHRLRSAPNLILTPHVAFFSATSLTNLQRLAAEEVHRALRGVPLRGAVS